MRVVGGLLLIVAVVRGWMVPFDLNATTVALAVTALVALAGANFASVMMERRGDRATVLVIAQLVLDTVVTVVALWLFDPSPSSYATVAVGLPALHGALRYRLSGAVTVWLAAAAGQYLRVIVGWLPGSGLEPLFELITPLAIALAATIPAGYLADQLTMEIRIMRDERTETRRKSRLLATLSVAAHDLATHDLAANTAAYNETIVHAALELGFTGVEIIDVHPGGDQRIIASGGTPCTQPRPIQTDASTSHVIEDSDHSWFAIVQTTPETRILRVWEQDHSQVWGPRLEALELFRRSVVASLAAAQKLTELETRSARLQHRATHDQLTGLLNRDGLLASYDAFRHHQHTSGAPFAVIAIDLDGFKRINDLHGHAAGDLVLAATAARLQRATPASTAVARHGGDEFVLLVDLPADSIDALTAVAAMAATIDEALREPITFEQHLLHVGASAGTYVVEDPSIAAEVALREADHAMYEQKRRTSRSA